MGIAIEVQNRKNKNSIHRLKKIFKHDPRKTSKAG